MRRVAGTREGRDPFSFERPEEARRLPEGKTMPVLDAKALKTDRKGLAFLRAVLGNRSTAKAIFRKDENLGPAARSSNPRQTELDR